MFNNRQPHNIHDTAVEPAFQPLSGSPRGVARSVLGVPLLVENRTIGVIFADNFSHSYAFDDHAVHWLQFLAGQVAISIQNVHLFEAEYQQRLQAEALREVTLSLTSHTNLDEVLEEILSQVERIVPYQTASITLLENDTLRTAGWRGYDLFGSEKLMSNLEQPLVNYTVDRRAIQSGQPVVIHNTYQDPNWVVLDDTAWIRSHLNLPIRLRDRVLGTLRLDGSTPGEFTLEDVDRLEPLANAAAIALENARLFEAERTTHEQLRNLADHLQAVREEERTHIAREIHDEFGQALTALKMDLAWITSKLPQEGVVLRDKANSMSQLIDTTIQMVRRIATELRPGLLDDLGLTAAIEWQTQEFAERTGLKCDLQLGDEDIILERDLATAVFRIFQETLTNIARHAKATRVWVTLADKPDELVLIVRDNGQGITEAQVSRSTSLGLIGMRERVRTWNGKIKFQGIPGQGTSVTVHMPRDKTKEQKP